MLIGMVRRYRKGITWRYVLLGAVASGLFSAKAAYAGPTAKRLILTLAFFFFARLANGGVVHVDYSASAGAGAFAETFSQIGSQAIGPVIQDRDEPPGSYVYSPQGDNWGRTGVVASAAAELAHSTSSSSSEFWWNRQTGAGSLYVSAGAIAGGGSYWISEPASYSRNSYADAGASINATATIQFDQMRSVRYVVTVHGALSGF